MKKNQTRIVLTGAIILFAYIFLVMYPDVIGVPADAADTMITLFPGLLAITISIYGFFESQGLGRVASMIGLGFGLCYFLSSADTLGLVTAEMLNGLTVDQLQIWIIAITTILGAASTR